MKIGVGMTISSESLDVAALGEKAEELGFESVWLPEHPIMPVNTNSRYRGTPDGSIPEFMKYMVDPFVGLARVSAVTQKIKLGTGVCLIPERNPLLLAKEIATLDHFSGGRFIFGIGTGWLKEETEIMGGDFDHRWGQAREAILAMKELWTKEESEFHGKFYNFPPVRLFPKPSQKPHPPVILGGSAPNVFKRVAAWGDGWMPTGANPEQVKMARATLDELAVAAGRDPNSIEITVYGQPADAQVIEEFEKAGAVRAVVGLPTTVGGEALMELERIAERVLPG